MHILCYYILLAIAALTCHSCTLNISQVHTDGTATDIIDTDQAPSNALDANFPGAL